jgi:transcription antitermination factor NusG
MAKITLKDGSIFEGTIEELVELLVNVDGLDAEFTEDDELKVGDYVVPLESADDEYNITNTEMKLGKVVEGDVDCCDDIMIEVVAHENGVEVGKSYSVTSKHFRKATDEEVAQAKAELEFATFAEGDKVRLISGGGEYPLSGYENGKIYTVKSPKYHLGKTFGYKVQLTGGSVAHGYAKPKQLEKVTAEELAQTKAEQKWAKIGRKPGEFKKGDIVRVVECTGAHEIGEIVELAEDGASEYLGNDGVVYVGEPEQFELIAPVESRVDVDD